MLISENTIAQQHRFEDLLLRTNEALNNEATKDPNYFREKHGRNLEKEIYRVMNSKAKKTEFEGSIQIISGQKFPDIIAKRFYGVEVKSTTQNHWVTIGNSILESTRVEDVNRIYLMFGKLADPVSFAYKPYEKCLSDVVVTHYPRYKVDMQLAEGDTIFDKIEHTYDSLRTAKNPIGIIGDYYKSQLKDGEALWWLTSTPTEEDALPAKIRLLNYLPPEEKSLLQIAGMVYFPEIFTPTSPNKYNRFALWLIAKHGVTSTSLRDLFSAGGRCKIQWNKKTICVSGIIGRLINKKSEIVTFINKSPNEEIIQAWQLNAETLDFTQRLNLWRDKVNNYTDGTYDEILEDIIQHNIF